MATETLLQVLLHAAKTLALPMVSTSAPNLDLKHLKDLMQVLRTGTDLRCMVIKFSSTLDFAHQSTGTYHS